MDTTLDLQKDVRRRKRTVERLEDPPVAQSLLGDVRWAWIWLILRLYVGWAWLQAGWGKLNNPAWTGDKAGAALTGFVNGALTKTAGEHPDVQGWYAWFLENAVLPNAAFWGYLVAWGETLVGIALILGILTGIAAFFGSFMNVNFLLTGAVSTNPILFVIATWLVLAWKTAGWWGLDRWLLPALGTPWSPGLILRKSEPGRLRPEPTAEGVQEALIRVKGGYTPDVLMVKAGQPVRLNFERQETAACSEEVVFPAFDRRAKLPEGEIVPIEFTPEQPGEYDFQCHMGMLHGKLIVV